MIEIRSSSKGVDGSVELITLSPGLYHIECGGAKGGAGNGNKSIQSCIGGFGATIEGVLELSTESKLMILPGNPGTDHPGTSGDGATGAGGGGTYVALIVDEDYPGALLTEGFTNTKCNNLHVIPLMVAAGGNGGRDYGYSKDGATYHGVHTTHDSFKSGANQGGSFANLTSKSTSNGGNFIQGGHAATNVYGRNGMSYAGFGGGGTNKDDGEGGGGGGYYGGHTTLSACSYYNSELISNFTGTTGTSLDYGYVLIKSLAKPGPYVTEGEFTVPLNLISKYENIDYIKIEDTRLVQVGTTITSYITEDNSTWKSFDSGESITITNNKNVKLKYELSSTDMNVTPTVSNLSITIALNSNNKQLLIKLDEYTKFNNAIDYVTVLYDATVPLSDNKGILVNSFSKNFTPINVVKKVNPHECVEVSRLCEPGTISYVHIATKEGEDADIHNGYRMCKPGTISYQKMDNINP